MKPKGRLAEAMQEAFARQTYEEAFAEEGDGPEEGALGPSKSGYVAAFAGGVDSG